MKSIKGLSIVAAMTLCCGAAQAQEAYLKAGLLGIGGGYAQGLSSSYGVRGELTTIGEISHNGTSGKFSYDGKLRANQATAFFDWFPFEGDFRVSAGLGIRDTQLSANARPNSQGQITINNTTVTADANDTAFARVRFPTAAPYLGIGWGHNVKASSRGWGFIADVGFFFGRPSTTFDVNDSLRAKLTVANGGDPQKAQAEIDAQRNQIKDKADKFAVWPQLYVGVSYRF